LNIAESTMTYANVLKLLLFNGYNLISGRENTPWDSHKKFSVSQFTVATFTNDKTLSDVATAIQWGTNFLHGSHNEAK